MTPPTEAAVRAALKGVRDPEINHDIVELGMVQDVEIEGDSVTVQIQPTSSNCPYAGEIIRRVKDAVAAVSGVARVEVEWGVAG